MQRNMKLFLVMIPLLVLTGCILSSTPPEGPISLTWGTSQVFTVNARGTIQWYVDDVAQPGETNANYIFLAHPKGVYVVKVKAKFSIFPMAERTWTVTVTDPMVKVPAAANCGYIMAADLVCNTVLSCSSTIPEGHVISQSPAAGTMVKAGVTVTLTISSGSCTVEMPVPEATTCADIEAAGLICSPTLYTECSEDIPVGQIVNQYPAPGTMVYPGTTVSVTLASGSCTTEIPVPAATNCSDLTNAGLVCSTTSVCNNTVPAGHVVSQFPEPGTMVLGGSVVMLTISSGLCPVIVPAATSCAEIEAAGLKCLQTTVCSNTVPEGSVISLSPPAGTGVQPGSTVNLKISSGGCTLAVPNATSCAQIEAAGLVCETSTVCNNTIPAGGVISQNPAPGTLVEPGSTVTLVISSGICSTQLPPPQNVQASDVVLTSVTNPLLNHNLNDRIRVTWSAVTNATSYDIYSSNTPDGTYTLVGSATAPAISYDVMQTEVLNLPPLPTDLSIENINAYEAIARPILNNFKNYRYFKVKACSSTPYFTNSEFSTYNEGRIDYTLEEFFTIAKIEAGNPISRVIAQMGELSTSENETYYDSCGDGNAHGTVGLEGLAGRINLTFTNYIDSMNYIDPPGTIDCNGTRKMIINGNATGLINLSFNGTITGAFVFTGNFAGKFTNISISVANKEIQPGTCTVIYNGETFNGHTFGF
jgi:beta-lactam-binding protein with PASTA domain